MFIIVISIYTYYNMVYSCSSTSLVSHLTQHWKSLNRNVYFPFETHAHNLRSGSPLNISLITLQRELRVPCSVEHSPS